MRILLVEPGATGHHLALHVRVIAGEAMQRGWEVQLLTSRAACNHEAMQLLRQTLPAELEIYTLPDDAGGAGESAAALLRSQLRMARRYATGFANIPLHRRPDVVYVVTLDHVDKALALIPTPFGDTPFGGMLLGIRHHRERMGLGRGSAADGIREALLRMLIGRRNLSFVAVVDEAFAALERLPPKVVFVPDVGHLELDGDRQQARTRLGCARSDFVVLAYGALTARKGVRELVEAASAMPGVRLLLAGAQDAATRAWLREYLEAHPEAAERVCIADGFHTPNMEGEVFLAADAVWLGYRDFFGSSGVLWQAAAAGLRVIGCREGLIGWQVRKYQLGAVVDPRDADAVRGAIALLAKEPPAEAFRERTRRLAAEHSPQGFARRIVDLLAGARRHTRKSA